MTRVRVKGLNKNLAKIKRDVHRAAESAMNDCMTDLVRVASETTPLDDGNLEMSGEKAVNSTGKSISGKVRFEVWNDHPSRSYDFNYAIWIHEETYNLGPKSETKSGGKGMSGRSYPVGRKYLTRPFFGEADTYRNAIDEKIQEALKE